MLNMKTNVSYVLEFPTIFIQRNEHVIVNWKFEVIIFLNFILKLQEQINILVIAKQHPEGVQCL